MKAKELLELADNIKFVIVNGMSLHTVGYLREVEKALRSCAAESAEPVAWQPIETAPKDGTRILIADERDFPKRTYVAPWRDREWQIMPYGNLKAFPTHWMQLPAAPGSAPQPAVPAAFAELCAGGIDPGFDECPKCGATMDDACGYTAPQPAVPAAAKERAYAACLDNLREAWSALAMIRETVETLGPIGAVQASEHLDGPTFMHEAEALVAGVRAMAQPAVPADVRLDPLADLVTRFSAAMLEKLRAAEAKYGWKNGWMEDDWRDSCLRRFHEHIEKGDPRDVANYCAFMWHHGWNTALASQAAPAGQRWMHKKRGTTYLEIGRAKLQTVFGSLMICSRWVYRSEGLSMVVYRSEEDGSLLVRPEDEFEDGRFEKLPAPAPADQQKQEG